LLYYVFLRFAQAKTAGLAAFHVVPRQGLYVIPPDGAVKMGRCDSAWDRAGGRMAFVGYHRRGLRLCLRNGQNRDEYECGEQERFSHGGQCPEGRVFGTCKDIIARLAGLFPCRSLLTEEAACPPTERQSSSLNIVVKYFLLTRKSASTAIFAVGF
jgi:hypothetical protein